MLNGFLQDRGICLIHHFLREKICFYVLSKLYIYFIAIYMTIFVVYALKWLVHQKKSTFKYILACYLHDTLYSI